MDNIHQALNKFRNKKIRILTNNNFTYITFNFEFFGKTGILFTDKIGHEVMITLSDIKKIEVVE